jgi:hypothetical protein
MVLELDEICGAVPEEDKHSAGRHEADLKPEYCHYKDEGCEYAYSCLSCPFPQCFYDDPRGSYHRFKALRNKEIKRLLKAGRKVKELALLFQISQRTINRVLKSKR